LFGVLAISWLALVLPSAALAETDTVLLVTAVEVEPGQRDAYLAKVKQLQGIIKRLGVKSTTRVWEATIAGDGSGTVVVGIEYPSLAAYAEGTEKMGADAEWTALLAGMDPLRTVQSRSLYREITP
jgi:hypothetical protein